MNGLAVSFVLALDDELAEFVVSVADRPAIEESLAHAAAKCLPVREMQLFPLLRLVLSFVAATVALSFSWHGECQEMISTTLWIVCFNTVLGAALLESLVTAYYLQNTSMLKKLQVVLWAPCEAMLTYYIVLAFTFVTLQEATGTAIWSAADSHSNGGHALHGGIHTGGL